MNLEKNMTERKELLERLLAENEEAMKSDPTGILRASRHHGGYQYYVRENKQDKNGRYLQNEEIELARQLAQAEYHKHLDQALRKELQMIHKWQRLCNVAPWDEAYEKLTTPKRNLVEIPVLSDEDYAAAWSAMEFERKEFHDDDPELYSTRGERVRSKSEVLIADALYAAGISYHYEMPLKLKRRGVIHPDFTVLRMQDRKAIYWEHFGKMDDYEYRMKAFERMRDYEANGYYLGHNLIATFETRKQPLDTRTVRGIVEQVFSAGSL